MRALSEAVLLTFLISACSPRSQRTCARDDDCGLTATCSDGICLGQLPTVTISSPSNGAFTNRGIAVEVTVAYGVAEKIELLANGGLVASLESRSTYDWDTSVVQEGTYELVARAIVEGQVVTSEPRTIVVDHTAPSVLARTPQPGDGNVPFGTPLQVTFSESMSRESVTDSRVSVESASGGVLSKQLALSADGKTLSIMLSAPAQLPASISISLQGLTDLAGNVLAPFGPWNCTVQLAVDHIGPTVMARIPEQGDDNVPLGVPFQVTFSEPIRPESVNDGAVLVTGSGSIALSKHLELSSDGKVLSIALTGIPVLPASIEINTQALTDLAGNPVAPATAWSFSMPVWWHPWPLPVNDFLGETSTIPAVALDAAEAPVVAYAEKRNGKQELFVRWWNGTSWLDLASPLRVIGDAYSPAVAMSHDGSPVIAWLEFDPASTEQYVLTARWTGEEWRSFSGDRLDSSQAINVNKAAGVAGGVHANPAAMKIALAIDNHGNPVVAWPEIIGTVFNVFVAQWNGTGWNRLGSPNTSGNNSNHVALVMDEGRPLLAVQEYNYETRTTNVRTSRWESGWTSPFGTGSVDAGTSTFGSTPTIAVDTMGVPIVAYVELVGITPRVVVKRWNQTTRSWNVASSGLPDGVPSSMSPVLSANKQGDVVLAYSLAQQILIAEWSATRQAWSENDRLANSQGYASPVVAVKANAAALVAWTDYSATAPAGSILVMTPNR